MYPSLGNVDKANDIKFKQLNCTVLNLAYFDFLKEIGIVNPHTGNL
jgi:hypothetical protein